MDLIRVKSSGPFSIPAQPEATDPSALKLEIPTNETPAAKQLQQASSTLDGLQNGLDIERASSTSSAAFGDMAGAGQNKHYQPKQDIITRLEFLGERDMKVQIRSQGHP